MQTVTLENAISRLQALPPKHQEEIVSHINVLFNTLSLKKNNAEKKSDISIVDELSGCISLPEDFDMKAEKLARLEAKYLND